MIQIPDLFRRTLADAPSLEASVYENLTLFEPWLEQSGMPFFPGFTDHSPRHVNDVLNTAASLMSDTSYDLLSAEDVSVLCMSILLHDCGMHLTQDGFRALISSRKSPIISGLGDQPWDQLWKDFLSEAHRFGQDRLIAIFGDAEPVVVSKINMEELSERDCLLIGEFVRRHHTRLAHEIALRGVPTRSEFRLELVGFDEDIKDLAGLVARSHGMSIRDTFPYLDNRYGIVAEYRHIKAPFLMAVLRIADYVQVQSERALKSLLSVKELRSPISRQEWRAHFAVKDVSTRHEDPEALYVHARPVDVKTYLKLSALFKDIQRELDESWATIGEVYGRLGDMARLGLTVRRIRSNLDDKDKFERTVPYIPIKAAFDSSGPDLLKLLVGPLYDYDYKVGVRELLQNSVDACRELSDLRGGNRVISDVNGDIAGQESDVVIDFEESENGTGWITVTDKGVGMTLDTVTRYFLIAGASFRNSDVWKIQHTDDSGQARVIRGGRFGVGALAAFLLGEEIKVTTRHVNASEMDGIEFNARVDDPVVDLRRCAAPIGTSIRVWVSDPDVFDFLRPRDVRYASKPKVTGILDSWDEVDWFAQEIPRVIYRWKGYNKGLNSEYPEGDRIFLHREFRPRKKECVPIPDISDVGWYALAEPGPYKAIYWRYSKPEKQDNDEHRLMYLNRRVITVNGIRVQELDHNVENLQLSKQARGLGPDYSLLRPSIAVFDPAGICPINLQRSAISFDRMGVDEKIAAAVLRNHLSEFAEIARVEDSLASFKKLCDGLQTHPGIIYGGQISPMCISSRGVFIAAPELLSELKIETLFFVDANDSVITTLMDHLDESEALCLRQTSAGGQDYLKWFRGIFSRQEYYNWYTRNAGLPNLPRSASVALLPRNRWELVNEKGRVSYLILSQLNNKFYSNDHELVTLGDDEQVNLVIPRVESLLSILNSESEVVAWKLIEQNKMHRSLLCDIWLETFKGPLLS